MTVRFNELMKMQIETTPHVVSGLVPVGLTLLASRPKMGKSWLVYDMAISVASGRDFLDRPVDAGDVLYWALEDSEERLQSRGQQLIGDTEISNSLELETVDYTFDPEEVVELLSDWVMKSRNPRLIIIDTLKKVRRTSMKSSYSSDYDFVGRLQKFAQQYNIALVGVYHTTKAIREDPLDSVQDTTGTTAAPDSILILRRKRGSADAELSVISKSFSDCQLSLRHDEESGRWINLGDVDADMSKKSPIRQQVIDYLSMKEGPQRPKDIAEGTKVPPTMLRIYLRRMTEYGEVVQVSYGSYALSDALRERVTRVTARVTPAPRKKARSERESNRVTRVTASAENRRRTPEDILGKPVRKILKPTRRK